VTELDPRKWQKSRLSVAERAKNHGCNRSPTSGVTLTMHALPPTDLDLAAVRRIARLLVEADVAERIITRTAAARPVDLRGMVVQECIRELRRQRRGRWFLQPGSRLSIREHAALILYRDEGLSVAEIADLLGISKARARSTLQRALLHTRTT